jgi:dienelactone hydrolase
MKFFKFKKLLVLFFVYFGAAFSYSREILIPVDKNLSLKAVLYQPEKTGKLPAIILLHGCGGIFSVYHFLAQELSAKGYVVLLLDSLSTRGVPHACFMDSKPSPMDRLLDLNAAKNYLEQQIYIDSTRIGLIGWSHGGITALFAALPLPGNTRLTGKNFAAIATYYPMCYPLASKSLLTAPLLIQIGANDDWTYAKACSEFTKPLVYHKESFELMIYPNSTHSFDHEGMDLNIDGHILKYNPETAKTAKDKMFSFLAKYLKP